MNINEEQLKQDISQTVKDNINDIFRKFQERLYIKSGDIAPMDALELDLIKDKLSKHIYKVLMWEMD